MEVGDAVVSEKLADGDAELVPGVCSPVAEEDAGEESLLFAAPEATPHAPAANGTIKTPAIALANRLPLTTSQMV